MDKYRDGSGINAMGPERRREVGASLRALVAGKGVTFASFAKGCGCSASDVAKYVGGVRPMPLETCWRAAAQLGVTPDELCLEEARTAVDFAPGFSKAVVSKRPPFLFDAYVAAQLRGMRGRRGDIATAVGVSEETWGRWERGDGVPSLGQAICACRALGCSLAGILPPPSMAAGAHGPVAVFLDDPSVTEEAAARIMDDLDDGTLGRLMEAWALLDLGKRDLLAETARCWAGLSD